MAQKAIGQLSVRFTVAPTGGSRTLRCENSKVAAAEGKGLAVTLQGCAACFLKCILSFLPLSTKHWCCHHISLYFVLLSL